MKTTQTGWLTICIFLPIITFLGYQIFNADSTSLYILTLIIILMVVCLLIFYQLTISIDDKQIKFWFGFGLIGKTYNLEDIKDCKTVTNSPLYGWGIRMMPNGWLYNVSGLKAVELSFKNSSKKIRIGTNHPEEIAKYVNQLLANPNDKTFSTSETRNIRQPIFWSVLIITIVSAGALFYYGIKAPEVLVDVNQIKIKGMYGITINVKDINQIDTISELPKIKLRSNGFAFGKTLKGHFNLSKGKALLLIRTSNTPYIYMEYNESKILYLNLNDAIATRVLFKKIVSATHKPETNKSINQ
jgi:hypothetical protein